MYQLIFNIFLNAVNVVFHFEDANNIPVNPENTDYQTFKQQINNETALLKDVDGNLMTPEEAKAYVATMP